MSYIFNTQANSYFLGQDLRVEDTETHSVILLAVKDEAWGVNVKSEWVRMQRSQQVQTAADNLGNRVLESLEHASIDFFWREAAALADSYNFDGILTAGRTGGWLCIAETEHWDLLHPEKPITEEEGAAVTRFLDFCFLADDLRETAEAHFDDRILEANMNLQVTLSEYADWVGADIRSLDGDTAQVVKLEVIDGGAALRTDGGWFAFAHEAKLIRRANGQVPTRLTAEPIMEKVFQIIEDRGNVSREQLDGWLDASEDHDPNLLYVEHVAPAVNAIEDAIKADMEPRFGEVELASFSRDGDGGWPDDTVYLYELPDGALFEDVEARMFNRVGDGPAQGSVEIVDDNETHAYWNVTARVRKVDND